MRKAVIIAAIVTMFMLSGCEQIHDTEKAENQPEARMMVVDNSSSYRIYVDKETRVMYLRTKIGYGEALCVMLDADGTPALWEGEQP